MESKVTAGGGSPAETTRFLNTIADATGRSRNHFQQLFRGLLAKHLFAVTQEEYRLRAAGGAGKILPAFTPLSPKTLARGGRRKGILRKSDRMYRSLKPGLVADDGSYTPGSEDQIANVTVKGITWGSKVPYFDIHQKGKGHVPARPPMPTNEAQRKAIIQEAKRRAIAELLRRINGRKV